MEIWLPPSERPAFICRICRTEFPEKQAQDWERHVVKCGKRANADGRLRQVIPRVKDPLLYGDADPEKEPWIRERFRRGIDETGRPLDPGWR